MTRDKAVRERTIKRFLECEAKRSEARVAAWKKGKSEDEVQQIAHEAAKAHWNSWANKMLAKRKALEESGAWKAEQKAPDEIRDRFEWEEAEHKALEESAWATGKGKKRLGGLKPKNAETRAWMEEAETCFSWCLFLSKGTGDNKEGIEAMPTIKSIEIEGRIADFTGFVFPGTASFYSATFSGDTSFDSATFSGEATFESTTFLGEASFPRATFSGPNYFAFANLSGDASFGSTTFSGVTSFIIATFSGKASFGSATFSGDTSFFSATFSGEASFFGATFSSEAAFPTTTFSGETSFFNTTFSGETSFFGANFSGKASFESATFLGEPVFPATTFSAEALFSKATFSSGAAFLSTTFSGPTSFESVTFSGKTCFDLATFSDTAAFESATFTKSTSFRGAKFGTEQKKAHANFTAIKVERVFDLSKAYFSEVPSFCQADFKQAPDLDGVDFPLPNREPAVVSDPTLIPKYRAIRRMAIQGADYESEHKAFKGELRSRRWCIDKWWHPSAWLGVALRWRCRLRPLHQPARDCLGRHNTRVRNVLWEQSLSRSRSPVRRWRWPICSGALLVGEEWTRAVRGNPRCARESSLCVPVRWHAGAAAHSSQRDLRRDAASVSDKRRSHFPRPARGEEQVQDQVAPSTVIAERAFAPICDP